LRIGASIGSGPNWRPAGAAHWKRAQEYARTTGQTDHLGVQPQRLPGLVSVGLCVPTGRLGSRDLDGLDRLSEIYGSGKLRLTTGQNIILINVAEATVAELLAEPLLKDSPPDPNPFFGGS